MNGRRNMIAVFQAMLASLGGTFTPAVLQDDSPDPDPRKRRSSGRFASHARPLSMDGYYTDSHGSLRRIKPKRDKSISARQWRKQRRAARQAIAGGAE